MDESTARLVASLFITIMAGIGVLGARFIIKESMAKAYCDCFHEFNDHWVAPRGYLSAIEYPKLDTCKICSCKKYNKNEKDKRNSPPTKFW